MLRPAPIAALVVCLCATVLALSAPVTFSAAIATIASITADALLIAVCWMASAWGLGMVIAPALGLRGSRALALAIGAAALLWVDHLLGTLGILSPAASWAMLIPGWIGLVVGIRTSRARASEAKPRPVASWWIVLAAPPIALMIVAACLPPGTIWVSEARGYDVLSYHLELPKEWLAGGRVWPVDHNVYSYLPSYMESAFARLAALSGLDAASPSPLGAGTGVPIHAAQFLHVLFALTAAWCVGALVHTIAPEGRGSRLGAPVAAGALVGVPWIIVTGSMAYNEMAMCAMLAGALLAAWHEDAPGWKRGIAVGLCIGAACSIKPTALFLAAPPAAIALAARIPKRQWLTTCIAGATTGLVMLAPWLVRNTIASGNPVFPALASVFGPGHWSEAQHARWRDAHHLDLSIPDRLARAFSTEFGMFHSQWSIWVFIAVAAAIACLAVPRLRRATWPLAAGALAQIIAWMAIGHLQPRFLVPVVIPSAALVGVAIAALALSRHRLAIALGIVAALAPCADAYRLFLRENAGDPMRGLIGGVEVLNGSAVASPGPPESSREAREFYLTVGPTLLINNVLLRSVPAPRILFMGGATPLYIADTGEHTTYATTWDTSPLTRALDACNGDVDRVIAHLRDVDGFTHILIDAAELDRLRDSGYADPRITPELGLAIARRTRVVLPWPDRGQVLVALDAPPVDSPAR